MVRSLRGQKLCLATHNRGKVQEIAALLAPHGVEIVSAADLGLPEPAETGTTFAQNARLKAHAAAAATGLAALADDSGICIDALDGAPGVYTADWAETPTGRNFHVAMTRTWGALEAISAPEPRLAQFRCTLVVAWPDGVDAVFEGVMSGQIVWPMRGSLGHGYDPIFQPSGHDITFAEMDRSQKNRVSHRADALAKLEAACFT